MCVYIHTQKERFYWSI